MNIWQKVRDMFAPRSKGILPTGNVYDMTLHRAWGNTIYFYGEATTNYKKQYIRSITGHLNGMNVGDELRSPMTSGKIGRFLIVELRYEIDPPDQFFGKALFVGYL